MRILERIDEFFDWLVFERTERKTLSKGIKKLCKKHYINRIFLEMYLNIQKQLMDTISSKDKTRKAIKEEIYFSNSLLLGRIFEINLEFIQNMKKEYYHSANALTRQMIEIYRIASLLNYNKEYCKTFLGKNDKYLPNFKDIRNILKEGNHFPKIKDITKGQFFDSVEADYSIYSGLFHPKQDSFVHNLWVYDTDEKGNWTNPRPYNKNTSNKNITIFLFPKKTPFHPEYLKRMIHVFYTYTVFVLDELKKLNVETIQESLK